ncbi:hypothetical protein O3Q52_20060 [Streptomyces sp. ActVer]|uniref:hypothetical protein n=1 Tax=Streptomyces sp. ActVer TaxID=3014558 RepID=UPI0022B5A5D0|nr:hypothetical protein [Streptomyces sp. ActVer]MCZ4510442.1 hypothetical protein [Streptomyces sp. ActVer]
MTPAKRKPARRSTATKRRKPAARKHPARRVKIPRGGPIHARLGSWLVLRVVAPMVDTHRDDIRSRKDAAIVRLSHRGCPKCHGEGMIATRGKSGEFTGSKSCTAKPAQQTVSRWQVQKAARFGTEKRAGLIGWTCPCGKKEKPRYRDPKQATKALRAHERKKHGGQSVGGGWTVQQTEAAALAPSQPTPAPKTSKAPAKAATP